MAKTLDQLMKEEYGGGNGIDFIPEPQNLSMVKKRRLIEKNLEAIAASTGYLNLDRLIKGFIPGHLYTLSGETNLGKTSLAANFAINVALQKKKVLYIALEPETTIIDYLASVYHDLTFPELTDDHLSLENLPIDVYSKEDIDSAEKLVKTLETLERYHLVIVDHIGYFITSQTGWLQQQSNTVKKLVAIAKKKPCPIMIIAHLRKKSKKDKNNYVPTADDISGSAAFKQDSTEVLIATRQMKSDSPDEVEYSTQGKLYVTKTKVGPNGSIPLMFSERKAKILSTSWDGFDKSVLDVKDIFDI